MLACRLTFDWSVVFRPFQQQLLQSGPLVSQPPANVRFLLLLCGDIEHHPGPSQIEDRVKCLEAKVDSQAEHLEEKLNKLTDMMSETQSHDKQLERKFQQLEDNFYDNNKQIELQVSLLKESVSALQSAIKRKNEQLDSLINQQDFMSSCLRKLEEEIKLKSKNDTRAG